MIKYAFYKLGIHDGQGMQVQQKVRGSSSHKNNETHVQAENVVKNVRYRPRIANHLSRSRRQV